MPRWPMESTTPKAHRSRRSWHGREAVGARLSCARPPAGQHIRIEILSSPVEPCLMLASPLDPATGALIVGSNVRLAGRPQERAAPTVSRPCPDRMHRKRDDRGSQDISQLGALCAPLTTTVCLDPCRRNTPYKDHHFFRKIQYKAAATIKATALPAPGAAKNAQTAKRSNATNISTRVLILAGAGRGVEGCPGGGGGGWLRVLHGLGPGGGTVDWRAADSFAAACALRAASFFSLASIAASSGSGRGAGRSRGVQRIESGRCPAAAARRNESARPAGRATRTP